MAKNDINKVFIVGRIGRFEQLRYTAGGMAVLDFSLASNRSKKSGNEYEQVTDWVDVVIFGKFAEAIAPYITKGKQVAVAGRLQQETWKDKQTGKTRSKHKIACDELNLLGGTESGGGQRHQQDSSGYYPDEDYDGVQW